MIHETLSEFLANGGPYLLSTDRKGFETHWKTHLEIDGKRVVHIIGGVDVTVPDVSTAVINLLFISGALSPVGDEVGTERFIIYQKDHSDYESAKSDIEARKGNIKIEHV